MSNDYDATGISNLSPVGKAAFAILMTCVAVGVISFLATALNPTSSSSRPALLGGSTVVRMSHYNQIPTNSTYEQVASIIGNPGKQMSHQQMAGYTNVIYIWQNSNGSNLICSFQNGRLTNKTQTMLPD